MAWINLIKNQRHNYIRKVCNNLLSIIKQEIKYVSYQVTLISKFLISKFLCEKTNASLLEVH